jgi:hypothetical protein
VRPSPLVLLALLLLAGFGAVHALGLREAVSVLSGTAPPGGESSALLGVVYALSYFAALILAPILLLASGIELIARRSFRAPAADPSPPRPR